MYAGKFKNMLLKINYNFLSSSKYKALLRIAKLTNMNCKFNERIRVFTWRQVRNFGVPEHKKNGHVGDHVKFVYLDLESNFFHV